MWLVIFETSDLKDRVHAVEHSRAAAGVYDSVKFRIREWDGAVPNLGDLAAGVLPDMDPTLEDPGYPDKVQQRLDFEALADKATAEIEWLDETIPLISTMTGAEVRDVVHRIAREQREELRAWRYILRRLA